MAEAVILVGVQGAGKTTYYKANLAATHAHVSRDVQGSARMEAAVLSDCLARGLSFAVDNTNVTRAARRPYVHRAKQAGYRVVCCFFNTPTRTAIGRNNYRQDKPKIPAPAILRAAKQLEPPVMEEGFDEIRVIPP